MVRLPPMPIPPIPMPAGIPMPPIPMPPMVPIPARKRQRIISQRAHEARNQLSLLPMTRLRVLLDNTEPTRHRLQHHRTNQHRGSKSSSRSQQMNTQKQTDFQNTRPDIQIFSQTTTMTNLQGTQANMMVMVARTSDFYCKTRPTYRPLQELRPSCRDQMRVLPYRDHPW